MPTIKVEKLILVAELILKKWRLPTQEPKLTHRTWQELLNGAPLPHLSVKGLMPLDLDYRES